MFVTVAGSKTVQPGTSNCLSICELVEQASEPPGCSLLTPLTVLLLTQILYTLQYGHYLFHCVEHIFANLFLRPRQTRMER